MPQYPNSPPNAGVVIDAIELKRELIKTTRSRGVHSNRNNAVQPQKRHAQPVDESIAARAQCDYSIALMAILAITPKMIRVLDGPATIGKGKDEGGAWDGKADKLNERLGASPVPHTAT